MTVEVTRVIVSAEHTLRKTGRGAEPSNRTHGHSGDCDSGTPSSFSVVMTMSDGFPTHFATKPLSSHC